MAKAVTWSVEQVDAHSNWSAHEEVVQRATNQWAWTVLALRESASEVATVVERTRRQLGPGPVNIDIWGNA